MRFVGLFARDMALDSAIASYMRQVVLMGVEGRSAKQTVSGWTILLGTSTEQRKTLPLSALVQSWALLLL